MNSNNYDDLEWPLRSFAYCRSWQMKSFCTCVQQLTLDRISTDKPRRMVPVIAELVVKPDDINCVCYCGCLVCVSCVCFCNLKYAQLIADMFWAFVFIAKHYLTICLLLLVCLSGQCCVNIGRLPCSTRSRDNVAWRSLLFWWIAGIDFKIKTVELGGKKIKLQIWWVISIVSVNVDAKV